MKIKLFCTLALTAAMIQTAQAQEVFNEMSYRPEHTIFKLNAPTRPVVRLYNDGLKGKAVKEVKMKRAGKDLWTACVKGNLAGKFYTFDIGNGETPGVFAKAVGVNGNRGAIINLRSTDPDGWQNDQRPALNSAANQVIYEMHVRDFTHAAPGISYPDKFLGVGESASVDYLKRLGVTAVHLLPVFDFASVDETKLTNPSYNWGYDPKNYNVPEGSYSTDPYRPEVRIREFKQMVQALHKAGIRVILDVVYNHTFDIKHSNFQSTYPDYYYRKNPDGTYSDGSGCGNETASERPLMRKFMLESVKYWIDEYHIDGFRFDLMGVHDIETMREIRAEVNKIDPTIYIYGEGWSAGHCAYPSEKLAVKAHVAQLNGTAAFSDELRDALRGPFSDDKKGAFLAGIPGEEESIKFGIAGAIAHPGVALSRVNYSKAPWATQPTEMISYVSCHDDMCLTDRLRASIPGIKEDEIIRLDLLAQTAVFTSQGVPFILSGEEMLRNKQGVHNSFNSPIDINALNWAQLKQYPQVFAYYQGLIQLRKEHPAFRLGDAELVRKHLSFLPVKPCVVGFMLTNHAGGDSWNNIVVILNGSREPQDIDIPAGNYTVVACDGTINQQGLGHMQGGKISVNAQSALILHD